MTASPTLPTLDRHAKDLAEGRTTSRALVEAALARIDETDGEGARAFVRVDREEALLAADYMDALRARGAAPSAYAGIPISAKDLFDLAGQVTTAGSTVLAGEPPAERDAPAIARLKQAGLVVLGRTNMTEFAYSGVGLNPHYGTPASIWDRATRRIPGGSSAGAGVAVAEAMGVVGIGTDTGGSCRIPAAFNGIVGYKPSSGRVPCEGAYPLAASLDSVGPLAPSVACAAAIDALMAGDWDGAVGELAPARIRIGVPQTLVLDGLDDAVARDFERALGKLSEAGMRVEDVTLAELAELPKINAGGGLAAAEAYAWHRDMLEDREADYDPRIARRILAGKALSAADLIEILAAREVMIDIADAAMDGFDVLALPAVAIVAPPVSALDRDEDYMRINATCLRNTAVANFLDGCAITMPMQTPGEAPTGLMLMAGHGADRHLFAVARACEALI